MLKMSLVHFHNDSTMLHWQWFNFNRFVCVLQERIYFVSCLKEFTVSMLRLGSGVVNGVSMSKYIPTSACPSVNLVYKSVLYMQSTTKLFGSLKNSIRRGLCQKWWKASAFARQCGQYFSHTESFGLEKISKITKHTDVLCFLEFLCLLELTNGINSYQFISNRFKTQRMQCASGWHIHGWHEVQPY